MNQLDTEINNYSIADILKLMKLSEENCALDTLFLRTLEILDIINETGTSNKKNIFA
jgi:hypothetical protein